MNPQIILAGCSFTWSQKNQDKSMWKPWSDYLHDDFSNESLDIHNVGRSSAGQLLISENIIKQVLGHLGDTKMVIIQWSAIGRGYFNKDMDYFGQLSTALNNNEIHTLIDDREFINRNELKEGNVTNIINQVSDKFYESSLIRIYLTHQFLKSKNIPYISFWGWEQITEKQNKLSNLIDLVHDDNFWTYGNYGGLSEYSISKLGFDKSILPNDFHPTSEAHFLFYKNIISPKLLENGFVKNIKTI